MVAFRGLLFARSWSYSSDIKVKLGSFVSSNCFAHALIYPSAFFFTAAFVACESA